MTIRISAQACTVGTGGDRNLREGRGDYEEYLPMGQPHSHSSKEDLPGGTP